MVLRNSLLLLLLMVLLTPGSAAAAELVDDDLGWQTIVSGIEFQEFHLPDPNNAFIVRMDRSNPSISLESMVGSGELAQDRETVSGMYSRYDQALNFWGGASETLYNWGMRNQAVVAINGSYFNWNNGLPEGGQVQSGWYAKSFEDFGGWSGFAWKLDRSAFIGDCVIHKPEKQYVSFPATGNTIQINGVNTTRDANSLVIYTPQYAMSTGTDDYGSEVLVEMSRPTLILPAPAFAWGTVRQIRVDAGNSLIPFNTVVLSAHGSAEQALLENVAVGSEVRVSQEVTSLSPDCSTIMPLSWTKTYASIQGAYPYLKDGVIRDFNDDPGATNRHPRTAIAYNSQYIYFIVVDGRDVQHSIGMTIHELAVFTRDTLGATHGVAQDGGGSSTMVINGLVVNNTYCNIYSCAGAQYHTYIPQVSRMGPKGQPPAKPIRNIVRSAAGIERTIGNGMLMMVVKPAEFSTTYNPGSPVTTVMDVEMRLGPGTNYAAFTTIPSGTSGIILDQMNGLDGVFARWSYWWYVDFRGIKGWLPESALEQSEAISRTTPVHSIPYR